MSIEINVLHMLQVKHEEVTGPEAEAAIAQITQQPPASPQEGSAPDPHASKPTTSALAEHDAAFPAIGAMNGTAGPGKSPTAVNGSVSVVATIGDESTYAPGALDTALETAPSSVSVCLTVGDEGEEVLVALTLDDAERLGNASALSCFSMLCPAACPAPCTLLFCALPHAPCCLPCPMHPAFLCPALPSQCELAVKSGQLHKPYVACHSCAVCNVPSSMHTKLLSMVSKS